MSRYVAGESLVEGIGVQVTRRKQLQRFLSLASHQWKLFHYVDVYIFVIVVCMNGRYDKETSFEVEQIDTEGEELLPGDPLALASASKGSATNASHASGHELSFEADSDEDKGMHKTPKPKESGDNNRADDAGGNQDEDTDADIRTLLALVDKLHKKNRLDKDVVEELRRQLNADSHPPFRSAHTPSKAPVVTERVSALTKRKKTTLSLSRLRIDVAPLSPATSKVSRHRYTHTKSSVLNIMLLYARLQRRQPHAGCGSVHLDMPRLLSKERMQKPILTPLPYLALTKVTFPRSLS